MSASSARHPAARIVTGLGSNHVPCERVDASFVDPDSGKAPFLFCNSVDLAITPEQLFEVLADAEARPRWAELIARRTPR